MAYKSKAFKIYGGIPERWKDAFAALIKLSKTEVLEDFFLKEGEGLGTPPVIKTDDVIPYAEQTALSAEEFSDMVMLAITICVAQIEGEDSIEDVVADLVISKKIEQKQAPEIIKRIKFAWTVAENQAITGTKIRRAIRKTAPELKGFCTQVVSVHVIDKERVFGDGKVNDYKPSVLKVEPMVVIQIDVDRFGIDESISFAVKEKGLTDLLEALKGALKELEAVKKSLTKTNK